MYMDISILSIIKNFKNQGDVLYTGKRNIIKIFKYDTVILNIKSFKKPTLLNSIIYRHFRKSKARRSFEFATLLLEKNIGTPKPYGYFENKNVLQLLDSYYVCEHLDADYVFRDLFDDYNSELEEILKQLAHFCFRLHEAGIEFKDHSPGNTLIKKNNAGTFDFYLIDLNRMEFHKKMSFDLRMKNLCRLTPSEYMIKIISEEYAKWYEMPKDKVFNLMWKYTDNFFKKSDTKRRLKKYINR